eukprot:6192607-Pleurochrysis_carterae.AAC.1
MTFSDCLPLDARSLLKRQIKGADRAHADLRLEPMERHAQVLTGGVRLMKAMLQSVRGGVRVSTRTCAWVCARVRAGGRGWA